MWNSDSRNEEEVLLYNVMAICARHMAKDASATGISPVEWVLKTSILCFSHAELIKMHGQFPTISLTQCTYGIRPHFIQNLIFSKWKNLLGVHMINELLMSDLTIFICFLSSSLRSSTFLHQRFQHRFQVTILIVDVYCCFAAITDLQKSRLMCISCCVKRTFFFFFLP